MQLSVARLGFAALALGLALTVVGCGAGEPPPREASRAELVARSGSDGALLILDVRSPEEYAESHVPGAVNIPHDELAGRLGELGTDRDRELIVYCESGRRAGRAIETLEDVGFGGVRHLDGDMSGWREAGLPTE